MISMEENSNGMSLLKKLICSDSKEIFLEELAMTCACKRVKSQDKWLIVPGGKANLSAELRDYLEKLRQIRNDIAHDGYIKSPRRIFADRNFSTYQRVRTNKVSERMPIDMIGIVYDLIEELRSVSGQNKISTS